MTLPIDRTALIAAATNQVPSSLIRSALNIAALTTPYDTIDELNAKVNNNHAAGAVGTTQLADGSVTTAKHADSSVTTAKIADSAVTLVKMADSSVGTTELVDLAVTNGKVADATLTAAKFVAGALTNETQNALRITELETDFALYSMFPRLGAETDDSPRIQRMIDYVEDNNIGFIKLPARSFYCATPLRISRPLTFEGTYGSRYRTVDDGIGTILFDTSSVSSTEPFITVKPVNDAVFLRGLHFNNLHIVGDYQNHAAVFIERIASDAQIENVMIEKFNYEAINLFETDDINITKTFILDCGKSLDSGGNPRYAISIGSADYPTNAIHVSHVHVEGCKYSLKMNRSFFINFVNCKFEQDLTVEALDLNNSCIKITEFVTDVVFSNCQFAVVGVNGWLNAFPSTLLADIPYFIEVEDNLIARQHVGFYGNTFRSKGNFEDYVKLIDGTTRPIIFKGNACAWLTDTAESIKLSNSIVEGNTFNIKTSTQNVNTSEDMTDIGKGLGISNSIISNNRIVLTSSAAIKTDYAFNGNGNNFKGNLFSGFTNKYVNSNMNLDRSDVGFSMTEANVSALYAPADIDYAAFTIKMNTLNTKEIYFGMAQNVTIATITGGVAGDRLRIYSDTSSFTIKIQGGSGTNQVRFSTWTALYTIKAADYIDLEFVGSAVGGNWHMVSEHVHNPLYAGSPISNVTPNYTGQEILNSVTNRWYKSTGIGGANWTPMNNYVAVPASATASGAAGDYAIDASYVYFCHTANIWSRVAIATW